MRVLLPLLILLLCGAKPASQTFIAPVVWRSCPACKYCGTGGITATGRRAGPGIVAVDPRYVPLGSRLKIEGLPGVWLAADTGGDVKGLRLDAYSNRGHR